MRTWDAFELDRLASQVRTERPGPDAEKMVWAFERALAVAALDEELLDYLLAAAVCLLAGRDGITPRDVLERYFRRSLSEDAWRERYAHLFA